MSTGMATIEEIEEAVFIFEKKQNYKLCILHCVSQYSDSNNELNLNNIDMLQNKFPNYEIGYSDHSIGHEATTLAMSKGVKFFEKHFTVDNSKIGFDNNMATEPKDFRNMIESCENAFPMFGQHERELNSSEISMQKICVGR